MANVSDVQLRLGLRSWGGVRKGAGRPRRTRGLPHRARPELKGRHPVHVTLRLMDGLPSLRTSSTFRVVREKIEAGASRFDFRVVHYSVQRNHVHLLVEADDKRALRRGLVGLQVRLARAINSIPRRAGRVFVDRYHSEVLSTPRQVRNALVYVLNNAKKHARQLGRRLPTAWVDPCSTAPSFFRGGQGLCAARTWLLGVGWRRWGRIGADDAPKPG